MKMTLITLLITGLATGASLAQENGGNGHMARRVNPAECHMSGPDRKSTLAEPDHQCRWVRRKDRGGKDHPRGRMDRDMMELMRSEHRDLRDLAAAVRTETDESKKAELIALLGAKLGELTDRVQAHREERLVEAESRLIELKERIEYAKTNRDSLIEEQLQRILSGERPRRPPFIDTCPHAKGGHHPSTDD